jgi:hypothetical protein
MTIDEAIRALTEARERMGGDAPLLMADELHVLRLNDEHVAALFGGHAREDGIAGGGRCCERCDFPLFCSEEGVSLFNSRFAGGIGYQSGGRFVEQPNGRLLLVLDGEPGWLLESEPADASP